MGLLDRTDSVQYEAVPYLGSWFVRMNRYGKYYYMNEQYLCDGKPSWSFDMNCATRYSYDKAHEIVNKLNNK